MLTLRPDCLPQACLSTPQGYLPRDLYDLNSKFGTEAELRDCIAVFHEQVGTSRGQLDFRLFSGCPASLL